jgi:hypothetical protein
MPEKGSTICALEGERLAVRRLAQPSPPERGAGPALGGR